MKFINKKEQLKKSNFFSNFLSAIACALREKRSIKKALKGLPSAPPRHMPEHLFDEYTLNGQILVGDYYLNNVSNSEHERVFTMQAYENALKALGNGRFDYYGVTLDWLLSALGEHDISGKTVCVFGATSVNCDAISLYKGASKVYILEYNPVLSEHPLVECLSYKDYIEKGIKCDVGISVSSFEHDGLGRYGDPLNPNGDLETMKLVKQLIKQNGLLFLSVPMGRDVIAWNAHRIYGKIRFPMLIQGWETLGSYGFSEDMFERKPTVDACHPVFVLQNI
ncbi:hypothetical protein tpqmel_0130 [Candidatus Gastranaerophilus sp. (ex Termes propinquus)]|nr:hypothetical protein tpqmel_0130 [Candidatus Gastranaerophilus sp. (ex Termes propinquus)]